MSMSIGRKELGMYRSTSKTGRESEYLIIRGGDRVVYCTCPAWKFKKNCKHLLDWQLQGGQGAHAKYEGEMVPLDRGTESGDGKMDDAVQTAINMMKG